MKIKTPLEVLLKALEEQKKSLQWTKDGGQFVPHPTTWLNQERWEDEIYAASDAQKRRELDADEEAAIRRILEEDLSQDGGW